MAVAGGGELTEHDGVAHPRGQDLHERTEDGVGGALHELEAAELGWARRPPSSLKKSREERKEKR